MKYYCYTEKNKNSKQLNKIKIMYRKSKILYSLIEIFDIANEYDEVVFDSILDLDKENTNNINEILLNYFRLFDKNVSITFSRSSSCDSEILKETLNYMINNGFDYKDERQALNTLLRIQIESYINFKDSYTTLKRYAQIEANISEGKSIGRPKGSLNNNEKTEKIMLYIYENCSKYNGDKNDKQCIDDLSIPKPTYYRYKKRLAKEIEERSFKHEDNV